MRLRLSTLPALFLILSAVVFSAPKASADQKGIMTLGLNGGYASNNNGGYAGVFLMYSFSRYVRIAPEVGFVFRHEGKTAFIADIDMHFPFSVSRGINVYPIAGVAVASWTHGNRDHARFGMDMGGGVDFNFTSELKLKVQAKYSLMNDESGVFVGAGIGYNF